MADPPSIPVSLVALLADQLDAKLRERCIVSTPIRPDDALHVVRRDQQARVHVVVHRAGTPAHEISPDYLADGHGTTLVVVVGDGRVDVAYPIHVARACRPDGTMQPGWIPESTAMLRERVIEIAGMAAGDLVAALRDGSQ